MRLLAGISLFLMMLIPAHAAEEAGRASINGRSVVLFSDGRWVYADEVSKSAVTRCPANSQFTSKLVPLTICFNRAKWTKLPNTVNAEFEVNFITSNRMLYGGVIAEPLPLGRETLRFAILENAKSTSEPRNVIEETLATNDGALTLDVLLYSVDIEDTSFRFFNAYFSAGEGGAFQIVFWTVESVFDRVVGDARTVAKSLVLPARN